MFARYLVRFDHFLDLLLAGHLEIHKLDWVSLIFLFVGTVFVSILRQLDINKLHHFLLVCMYRLTVRTRLSTELLKLGICLLGIVLARKVATGRPAGKLIFRIVVSGVLSTNAIVGA